MSSTSLAQSAGQQPTSITLTDAIQRAQQNAPLFAAAVANQKTTQINTYLTKATLLPTVTYHNQMLYTQPNGEKISGPGGTIQDGFVFIANNAVHEYVSQGSIDEKIGLKQFADVQVANAVAARASAELEIARRGLTAAVVSLYYSVSASENKRRLQSQALTEAQAFLDITQKREAAREVAHADVVKAMLQQQQKQRDLTDTTLAADKARLELAVVLFPDPRTAYDTVVPSMPPPLPTRDEVERLASTNNPEIRSAMAGLQASNAAVRSAKAGYAPDVVLNFSYGIDAARFAKNGPDGVHNLGYSIMGTLDIPVWNWLSTQKKIQQSEILRDADKVNLTATQRRLIANLEESYAEAAAARDQLTLLDQSLTTAEESLRLTKMRYSAGEATVLEVVDAQNAYLAAGIADADGALRYQAALAALQILTGTL